MEDKHRSAERRSSDVATRVIRFTIRGVFGVAVAAVMTFPGCTREREQDVRATAPTAPEPGAAVAADPDAAVQAAMLSIYWYARFPDAEALPEQVRPMPPDEAVRQVRRRATDPVGESRRRRAIAKLYSAARTPERLAWLTELGAPLDALDARVEMAGDLPAADPYVVEQMAIQVMEDVLGPSIPECQRTLPDSRVTFDFLSWDIDARANIRVRRDPAALAPVLDPQNWDVCGSKFWKAAYVSPGGDPPTPDPNAPTPGNPWKGILFEHFVFAVGPLSNLSSFEVLLDIDFVPAPTGVTTTYGLHQSLRSRIGLVEKAGGIVEDSGTVVAVPAEDDPTWSDITVTKKVRFVFWGNSMDFWVNSWGAVALEAASDDLYEGVCCQP